MRRALHHWLLPAMAAVLLWPVPGCGCSEEAEASSEEEGGGDGISPEEAVEPPSAAQDTEELRAARERMIDREYPLHGLVTGIQLAIRAEPDPEGEVVGWLRVGARVRLKPDPTTTSTCATGWHRVYPQGWACAGLGIDIGEEPPVSDHAVPPANQQSPLPYEYWFVKDTTVPEYHRMPSRDEQRASDAFAERYEEILEDSERRAERYMEEGVLPGEPERPAVVARYLDRGFFVAGTGVEVRAFRHFVRTVEGTYVKKAQLERRTGSDFTGIELGGDRRLPIAWTVRTSRPMIKRERSDGTIRWIDDDELEPVERQRVLEGWVDRRNIGGRVMHVLETDDGERYLRSWFAAVAERIDRPSEVGEDEPWVHVNLDQQTLVVYRGDEPAYATLVSTGEEGHETPAGVFRIRRKYIANTMSNLGGGLEDRYSIEDVPWTQYFEGSIALHGAFWHHRFGLTRSHGCVNLAPRDAHRVFDELLPRIPDGWLGVTTEGTRFRASHVVVTER